MKKRIVLGLATLVMIATLLTGCGNSTETIQSKSTQTVESAGNYFLFQTHDVDEYLSFLENFDKSKYEIIDISTQMSGVYTTEFYMVTYKTVE